MLNFFAAAVMILCSIFVHEWAHGFVARFCGAKSSRVFMRETKRLERLHAWERYVVFAAGPAANFAIAFWAAMTLHLSYVAIPFLDILAYCNLALGVLFLTPAYPFDGGRILLQFMGNRVGILRTNRFIKKLSFVIGCVFLVLGIVQVLLFPYNIFLLCAGVYILRKNKAAAEELQTAFNLAINGKNSAERARTLPVKKIRVTAETPVNQVLERLAGDYFLDIFVDEKPPLSEQAFLNHVSVWGTGGVMGDLR
jgi:Zn-dependent protease